MAGRQLMLDGLDYLREQMDVMQLKHGEWVFRAVPADPPLPHDAVVVEAYHEGMKKHAAIALRAEQIENREHTDTMLQVLSRGLNASEAAYDVRT